MQVKYTILPPLSNLCYLITDEATGKSALIDCPVWNEKMKAFIDGADLEYILLTHGHFDHTAGAEAVKQLTGAKILITAEDAPMLKNAYLSLALELGGPFAPVAEDALLSDGDSIPLGETEIRVISTPGHTPGSVCFIAGNALFTGDTLFRLSCGRTDFPGGNIQEMLASLHRLAALPGDYTVYPGHSEISTLSFERKMNPYMNRTAL